MKRKGFLMILTVMFLSLFLFQRSFSQTVNNNTDELQNLMKMYNSESNANAKYLVFAKKAQKEGYLPIASLFKATARAEQVHFEQNAQKIKKLGGVPKAVINLPEIKSTVENLKFSVKGETREQKEAIDELNTLTSKKNADPKLIGFAKGKLAVINNHLSLYKNALEKISKLKTNNQVEYFVCPVCGYVSDNLPKTECPVCKTPSSKFIAVK